MPVRILFRGLVLFKVNESEGTIVAKLVDVSFSGLFTDPRIRSQSSKIIGSIIGYDLVCFDCG